MATLIKTRSAQYPLYAEFVANFGDQMLDINGILKTFGAVYTDAGTFEVINLPNGATIVGGELIVQTAGVGPTVYTISVGTPGATAAMLAATSVLSAGRTALTGLGLVGTANSGGNVQITIASTVANATAGTFRVRVFYTIDGKANEVVPN